MNNDVIPLLQASIYIIVAIMVGLVGLYFSLLRNKREKDLRNKRREGLNYDTTNNNKIDENKNASSESDEDEPIKFV